LLDEILDELDFTKWEAVYVGKLGQPPIHPSILCKVLYFAAAEARGMELLSPVRQEITKAENDKQNGCRMRQ
jgi:hypothetical protein